MNRVEDSLQPNHNFMAGDRGAISKKTAAFMVVAAMGVGAILSNRIGGWDGPVTAEAQVEIEAEEVEIYEAVVDINHCVALAKGRVDVDISADVTLGVEAPKLPVIGQLGVHHTFKNVHQSAVHAEGDFDVCSPEGSLSIQYTPSYEDPKSSKNIDAMLVVDVQEMEARRPRVTNLGENGSVEGGNGLLLELGSFVGEKVNEAQAAGIAFRVGQNVLAQGLCDPMVLEKAEEGYKKFAIGFISKGLEAVGKPPLVLTDGLSQTEIERIEQRSMRSGGAGPTFISSDDILLRLPPEYTENSDRDLLQSAQQLLDEVVYPNKVDGIDISIANAECPANIELGDLDRAEPKLKTRPVALESQEVAVEAGAR